MNRLIKSIYLIFSLLLISNCTFSQKQSDIDSLKELINKTEIDSIRTNLYNKLSYQHLYSSIDSSKIYAQQALFLAKSTNYQNGIAQSLLNFGRISNIEGNFDQAIDYILKAMNIFQEHNDSVGITSSYYGLGLTYYYINNAEKSIEYSKEALNIAKKINKKDIYNIYNNVGLGYMISDQFDSALYYFETSIIIASEINDKKSVMYSYGNIANLYLSQENFEKALDIFMKVAELCIKMEDKISLSLSYANISVVYTEMADQTLNETEKKKFYIKAVENAEKALSLSREVNTLTHMNYYYEQLVRSYKGLNDYKKAFEYAEKFISSTDSLYNIDKVKEIEKLEKKFKNKQQKIIIESITKEKELKEDIIKKQDQIILIGVLAIFVILILLVLVFILYKKKRSANILLNEKNEAINNQRSEIASQRDNLSELAFELKKSNKTKDKYFSVFAHDLKNPFQSILGFSELLLEQAKNNDFSNSEKYAKYIHETTNKTFVLLENLLNWARVQRGVIKYLPKKYNLDELINECIEINEGTAGSKEILLSSDVSSGTEVFVDKYMFTTIIRNLITNAIKFTERGGKITIKSETKTSNIVDILVIDTGIGIKKENISRIFKLDHSATISGTENEKGTGLGLLVCKEFADKNMGELKIESVVGEGSTFTLSVPENEK